MLPYNAFIFVSANSSDATSDGMLKVILPDDTVTHVIWQHDSGYNSYLSPLMPKGTKVITSGGTNYTYVSYYKAVGNGSLYFYVGETVQNANLIDAGRIGELVATKTDMLQASGAGMPSNRYIDLTLGASGSTYTAPANGWFFVQKKAGAAYKYISLYCSTTSIFDERQSVDIEAVLSPCIPVKSGDVVKCTYNATGTTERCRFIFAQGEV